LSAAIVFARAHRTTNWLTRQQITLIRLPFTNTQEDLDMSDSIVTGGVHHIALTVSDKKRSVDFYTKYLGFQFVVAFGDKDLLSNGTLLLSLSQSPDPSQAIPDDRFSENRVGLDHVSLTVGSLSDLEAAATFLDANGVAHAEIKDLGAGFSIYVMVIRDPDNIQLELTAPYSG